MKKRGQTTIFIIIAIIIVALAAFIFFVFPKITSNVTSTSPQGFIQDCIDDDIEEKVKIISLNGGNFENEFYAEYFGEKIEYLCYTSDNFKTCSMQKPLLEDHVESEIKNAINEKTNECFDSLTEGYKKSGFIVDLQKNDFEVKLFPGKIVTTFDYSLSLTKGASDKYDEFEISLDSKLYELVSIAESILDLEATYGDSDVSLYMDVHLWLKAEKMKQTDGTTIYILTDRDTGNKFRFASRSMTWPPGI